MFVFVFFFFFKQKTAYEMVGSDWSSDVCSSDLWSVTALAISPATAVTAAVRLAAASACCAGFRCSSRARTVTRAGTRETYISDVNQPDRSGFIVTHLRKQKSP